jgi:hypothetical protein
MSDENERSVASDGSVAHGPLAWCVISDFYYAPVVSADEDAARRLAKGSDKVLALYPHPPRNEAWISVQERMPPSDVRVLIWCGCDRFVDVATWSQKYGWGYEDFGSPEPTHWMALPAPPTDGR